MSEKKTEFNKVLNIWDILVLAFGAMIGWAWVVSTGDWIMQGGVAGAMLGFGLGGVMIFFVGLAYAELTTAMPQNGGEHVFSYRALGKMGSFICTWAIIFGYTGVVCFEACALPTIFAYLYPGFLQYYLYTVGGFDIDLSQKWPRIKYADLIKQHFDIDVFNPDRTKIVQILKANNVEVKSNQADSRLIDNLWKLIRKESGGPFWLIEEPLSLSPLAKISPDNPLVTERFHPVIAGTEMGNGYSELNDPIDQLARFEEQQAMRDSGDDEAQMLDMDFVEMLEYGMPPACGWGNSERNFWLLEGVSGREAVPFPIIKRKTDN